MESQIPNNVIGAVSSVLAKHYYSHSKLNNLFMESGAPGDAPEGNCETKCRSWLIRCNEEQDFDALEVLELLISEFMNIESYDESDISKEQTRIKESLLRNQLSYNEHSQILKSGSSPASKSLSDSIKNGDLASIEVEFDRTISQLDQDPQSAITASSSIIEAVCKTYIETFSLEMPSKQNIVPLWRTVQQDLGLNFDANLGDDQRKILQGIASIIDGVGAYRTHIGSAHGRGIEPPTISIPEARLAVNASHTLVVFILERWQEVK